MAVNKPFDAPTDSFVQNMLSLVQLLREAGLPISTEQVMDFVRALRLIDIGQRAQVYHAARGILVSRYEQLRLFEAIFNAFWNSHTQQLSGSPQKAPHAPRHDQEHQRVLIAYMARKAQAADPEVDVADKSATY